MHWRAEAYVCTRVPSGTVRLDAERNHKIDIAAKPVFPPHCFHNWPAARSCAAPVVVPLAAGVPVWPWCRLRLTAVRTVPWELPSWQETFIDFAVHCRNFARKSYDG